MQERDIVMKFKEFNINGGKFILCESVKRDDAPEYPGVIRTYVNLKICMKPNKNYPKDTIDYTEINVTDFGGFLPARY